MTLPPPETLPQRPVDMLLRFSCPMCATVLEIPRARTGLEGPCPVCSATIVAPSVVVAPPSRDAPAQPAMLEPRSDSLKPEPEPPAPEVADSQTTRLCDLPPRPAFQTRREPNDLPLAQPHQPERRRERRRRKVVGVGRRESPWQFFKKEFWIIVLILVVGAIGLAFSIYGDDMFKDVRATPMMGH